MLDVGERVVGVCHADDARPGRGQLALSGAADRLASIRDDRHEPTGRPARDPAHHPGRQGPARRDVGDLPDAAEAGVEVLDIEQIVLRRRLILGVLVTAPRDWKRLRGQSRAPRADSA